VNKQVESDPTAGFMMMMDKNRDGKITEAEFAEAMKSISGEKAFEPSQLELVFKMSDKNNDGYLTKEEL
jgi:Ca2+-binding EF-hand superfamily protein